MPHDLIIRNGTVFDGTGAPGRLADVAVDADRITEVGDLTGQTATRDIDATGLVVTPGFVDLHTHLDAQIAWDPSMTSSSWHGVTTAMIGNCGVTFAPVASGAESYLAEMMESVEDISRDAILGALPWDWSSYPEFLDSIQALRPALNVVGLVGHCAIRYQVMGERSMAEDAEPTAEELARMRELVAESVAGGAVGYSTSRILLHVVPDGRKVPGTYASTAEHLALADGMNEAGGGLFQAVNDFETRAGIEFDLLRTMAGRAGDVLFAAGPGNAPDDPAVADGWDRFLSETRANAGRITAYTMTRPSGTLIGLAQVPPVKGRAWRAVMMLPTLADRVAALRDPATRAALVEEGRAKGLFYDPRYVHPLGTGAHPEFHIEGGESVADLAAAAGVDPVELVIDRLIESEGRELFNVWYFHRNRSGLERLLALESVYPGAGDAGAHAGQICDADAPTHFLAHWARDRGLVPVAEAIRRLTSQPAATLGLVGRGTVAAGNYADLNVVDLDALDWGYPEYVNDLPGGGGRLRVRARGYAATIVNGEVVTEQGETTGARPGRVLREFQRA